jgi:hypothetical protein
MNTKTSILINILRYADRPQDMAKLLDDAANCIDRQEKRIDLAIAELCAMIDGGEECRGRDSEISRIIYLLGE